MREVGVEIVEVGDKEVLADVLDELEGLEDVKDDNGYLKTKEENVEDNL